MKHDDVLGNIFNEKIKKIYDVKAKSDEFLVLNINCVNFDKFSIKMDKPFSENLFTSMFNTMQYIVAKYKCYFGRVHRDTMQFVLGVNHAYDGDMIKINNTMNSHITAKLMSEIMSGPLKNIENVPYFDSVVINFSEKEMVARYLMWCENTGLEKSINEITNLHFKKNLTSTKSMMEKVEMLKEINVDISDYGEFFLYGASSHMVRKDIPLTQKQIEKIPEMHRKITSVNRNVVEQLSIPSMAFIDNLSDVIFNNANPIVNNNIFARSVIPDVKGQNYE